MKLSCLALLCGLVVALASPPCFCGEAGPAASGTGLRQATGAVPHGEARSIRQVLGWKLAISAIVATAAGSAGLMLLAAGLLPAQVNRAELALRRGPWKVVLIGIFGVVVLLLAATALGKAADAGARVLGLLAAAVLAFLVWLAAIGLAATAKIVGRRLLNDEDGTQAPWRTVGAGAVALAASALVPGFGQALFLFFLCRGVGAATLALSPARGGPAAGGQEGEDR